LLRVAWLEGRCRRECQPGRCDVGAPPPPRPFMPRAGVPTRSCGASVRASR
jgi:hypothetical protein